jgi:hypothetical protein
MKRREKTVVEEGKVAFATLARREGGEGLFGIEDEADEVARQTKLRRIAERIVAYDRGYEGKQGRCPRCGQVQRYKGDVSRDGVVDGGTLPVQRAYYYGIVNLLMLIPALGREVGGEPYSPPLCSQCRTQELPPDLESFCQLLTVVRRREPMSAWTEMLGDRTIGREETLGLAWGLEALHTLLPLAGGLVRVLRPVIQIPMLAMFHPRKDLALGGSVAFEFIGDDDTRHVH